MEHIKIESLSFTYPNGRKALDSVSLSLKPGSFTVLCGTSGCGKSTLLRQLKTTLTPHGTREGRILLNGKELSTLGCHTQSKEIGYVMQDPDAQIVTDKVWHELAFGLESMGMDQKEIRLRVAEMASYFGIQGWFHKDVEQLSGGQKQLLNLASIMAMQPSLLILDEPTSQLDPIAAAEFLATIHKINEELGITILMTEHRLEEAMQLADQLVIMEQGKIVHSDVPHAAGMWLYEHNHEMFFAMPAPLKIYAAVEQRKTGAAPLSVKDGRKWLLEKGDKVTPASATAKKKAQAENQMITVQDVWFRYDRKLDDVVKGLTFHVKKGETYCLLGGNGTGKSTALSLISRVKRPYRGKILIEGKDIRKYANKELYRGMIGVVPQNPQSLFVQRSVRLELFEMIGGTKEVLSEDYPIDMEKKKVVASIAELTGLSDLLESHPYDLSGGEQQRLALAKILLLRPKVLLLDEPTKGLDASYKKVFGELLQRLNHQGVTVLMISHDIEFCARYAERCGMFFDGSIVTEGEPVSFFSGNSFYTTCANRMARTVCTNAITPEDVIMLFDKEEADA